MKIENFNLQHYHEVLELWKKAGIAIGSSDSIEETALILERNPDLFLVGKEQEKIIAVVIGAFDGRRGYVHHLAVDPDYQRKGYGKAIMNELTERFKQKRIQKIHLFIQKENKKVLDFYNKQGWEVRDDIIMMSFVPDNTLYKRSIKHKKKRS
ncbi:MAG: GNAT family N-acetyltransferase [Candidatus Hermodarchaeota archaeon]